MLLPCCDTDHHLVIRNTVGFDEKVVTFLGRITLQKGPEYFIEAAYKVLQVMKNVRFVMAGSGDMILTLLRDENLSVLGAQAGRPRTP